MRSKYAILTLAIITTLIAPAAFAADDAAHKEAYPNIQQGKTHLEEAEAALNRGDTIFGGHREKALKHIKEAQKEIDQAIAFADSHRVQRKAAKTAAPAAGN